MNRSTIKSNSFRRIPDSSAENKVGNGIFKKVSSFDAKNVTGGREELPVCVRETMSESIAQNTDHYKGIIRKKSPDKLVKKVQFLDSNKIEPDSSYFRGVHSDQDNLDYQKLLKSVSNSNLAQIKIDNTTNELLNLMSVIPPELTQDAQEDFFRTNDKLLSKMTPSELVVIAFLIMLFVTMILKHFWYDWLSPSKSPQLSVSEILMLMGYNIKRLCKNFIP